MKNDEEIFNLLRGKVVNWEDVIGEAYELMRRLQSAKEEIIGLKEIVDGLSEYPSDFSVVMEERDKAIEKIVELEDILRRCE